MEEILKEINEVLQNRGKDRAILKGEHICLSTKTFGSGLIALLREITEKHNLYWHVSNCTDIRRNVLLEIYKI